MTSKLTFCIFALVSIAGLQAQPSQSPDAVSPEQFQKGINGIATQIQQADINTADRIAALRDAVKAAAEAQGAAAEKQVAAVKDGTEKTKAAIVAAEVEREQHEKELRDLAAAEQARWHKVCVYLVAGAFLAIFIFGALAVWHIVRSNRKEAEQVIEAVRIAPRGETQEVAKPCEVIEPFSKILRNPLRADLENHSALNNGIKMVPFIWSEVGFDSELKATAELRDSFPPQVWFEGESDAVAWDKRNVKAREILRRSADAGLMGVAS